MTVGLIGTAFLALLNEVDRAGQLKPDSEIRDLALVMIMYLEWADDKPDYGLEDVKWMKDVVAYAKKGNIDLKATPLYTAKDLVKKHARVAALKGDAKPDRWNWAKKVNLTLSLACSQLIGLVTVQAIFGGIQRLQDIRRGPKVDRRVLV